MAKRKQTAQDKIDAADAKLAKAEDPSFEGMVEGGGDPADITAEDQYTALQVYSETPEFDREDVLFPRLRLAFGLTKEVQDGLARPGDWIPDGFEPEQEFIIMPMAYRKGRELRDPDTRDVLCISGDAKTGQGEPGGPCVTCPESQWRKDPEREGKNSPPNCTILYNYLIYVVDLDAVFRMTFSKSSEIMAKTLNTMIMLRGMGKVAIKLGASQKQGPFGNYHIPVITPITATEEMLEAARGKMEAGAL